MITNWTPQLFNLLKGLNPNGATLTEIANACRILSVSLPRDYHTFLELAGHGSEGIWRGSDYTIDKLVDIQEWARELFVESHLGFPQSAVCIHIHQGYAAYFLIGEGVWFFSEGDNELTLRHDNFVDFFAKTYNR